MCSSRKLRASADCAHAEFSVARAKLLAAVADLACSGAWHGDGAGNLAAWLSSRWQIDYREARELVREAEALQKRPALARALASAEISVDQCKALETLSRPGTDDDELWLETLPFWSLADLQREARKTKARELERRDDGVYFRMAATPDERYMRGVFQLHPEDGAAVLAAVEARIPAGTNLREWDQAGARALVELAKTDPSPRAVDCASVVLTVDAPSLAELPDADTIASLNSGGLVGIETARRISCDARIQKLSKNEDGKITGIGRMSRNVPPWLRRAVMERDGDRCTFPDCPYKVLECHHIIHWADGGPTELDNLISVCWTHHELLHEGRWSLRGEPGPHVSWIRPDGTPFEPRVRVVLDTC